MCPSSGGSSSPASVPANEGSAAPAAPHGSAPASIVASTGTLTCPASSRAKAFDVTRTAEESEPSRRYSVIARASDWAMTEAHASPLMPRGSKTSAIWRARIAIAPEAGMSEPTISNPR